MKNQVLNAEGKLVAVLESSTSGIASDTYVLKNEAGDQCRGEQEKQRRCYKVDSSDLSEIRKIFGDKNIVQGTFMDIDEDGRLDIVF